MSLNSFGHPDSDEGGNGPVVQENKMMQTQVEV